ncbi:MAG: transglutaminase domain-containing protein [Desulfobulbus sp.]|nr:MAG: transglutaminase domain-containing protein [Desulfobulbus sp.]
MIICNVVHFSRNDYYYTSYFSSRNEQRVFMSLRGFKIIVIATWLVLLGLLVTRDLFVPEIDSREVTLLQKSKEERFYGVWFEERRIGYVAETLRPQGEDFILDQEAHLLLNVLETTQPIDMQLQARLSSNLLLRDFTFRFTSPFSTMAAEGSAEGNLVTFRLDTGETVINDTITLPEPPLLSVNERAYLLTRLTQPGQKIKLPSFDPISLSGRESLITYHGQEKTLVRRRLQFLHHFTEHFAGMRTSFWLDESGRVVKEESPAGFQFIAEPEFRAKDITGSGSELLSAVAVPLRGPLPPENATMVTYRLTLPPDLDLDLPGGRQTLRGDLLTVTLDPLPAGIPEPATHDCTDTAHLSASRYIQANHPAIIELAREIVGDEPDQADRVRLLASWVFENLEKRPVIGLPDALTTLKSKMGDCNEHASLFAALARSLGIPTAIATGVTRLDEAMYYHAWNEVCLGGRWYSLDTTTDQLPADLYHIRFGRGDLDQGLKIGGLLGKLRIEIIPQKE